MNSILQTHDTEQTLRQIWQDVLDLPDSVHDIGLDEHFYLLGGDSLKHGLLLSRINAEFDLNLSFSELAGLLTIRKLDAALRDKKHKTKRLESSLPGPEKTRSGYCPASSGQEGLWYLTLLYPHAPFLYNVGFALHFSGCLQVKALEKAWQQVILRHRALRTTLRFDSASAALMQHICPAEDFPLEYCELSAHSLTGLQNSFVHKAFDFARALVRAVLVRKGEKSFCFLVCMHHSITDGWSGGILLQDLQRYYGLALLGQVFPREEDSWQYGDFCVWQKGLLDRAYLDEQRRYWTRTLASCAGMDPEPSQSLFSHRQSLLFQGETLARLDHFSRQEAISEFCIMFMVFKILLEKLEDSVQVLIGVPIANRQIPQWESVVGYFTNVIVLSHKLSKQRSVKESLADIQSQLSQALNHQSLPIQEVQKICQLQERQLYSHMFVYQNTPLPEPDFSGLETIFHRLKPNVCHTRLNMEISHSKRGITLELEYHTCRYDDGVMKKFLEDYVTLLNYCLDFPDRNLSLS